MQGHPVQSNLLKLSLKKSVTWATGFLCVHPSCDPGAQQASLQPSCRMGRHPLLPARILLPAPPTTPTHAAWQSLTPGRDLRLREGKVLQLHQFWGLPESAGQWFPAQTCGCEQTWPLSSRIRPRPSSSCVASHSKRLWKGS